MERRAGHHDRPLEHPELTGILELHRAVSDGADGRLLPVVWLGALLRLAGTRSLPLGERVPLLDARFFVTAVLTQHEAGDVDDREDAQQEERIRE